MQVIGDRKALWLECDGRSSVVASQSAKQTCAINPADQSESHHRRNESTNEKKG